MPDLVTSFVLGVIILALGFIAGRSFGKMEFLVLRVEDARNTKRVLATIYQKLQDMGVNTDTLLKEVNQALKSEGLSLKKPE